MSFLIFNEFSIETPFLSIRHKKTKLHQVYSLIYKASCNLVASCYKHFTLK
jgi:hypothetical protein